MTSGTVGCTSVMFYPILFILIPMTVSQRMTLCEYLHHLGRSDPHCLEQRRSGFATTEGSRLAKMISILEEREARRKAITFRSSRYALCTTRVYKDCREDKSSCESGYSCLSGDDDGRCCISTTANVLLPSNPSACPPVKSMGYTCSYGKKRTVTNWCRWNSDCAAGPVQLCCDTGCGYNVCLPPTGHVIDNGIRSIENDRCPPMAMMKMKCRENRRRNINWCNTDRECLMLLDSNVPQSCCPTPCGYNACVANNGYQLAFG